VKTQILAKAEPRSVRLHTMPDTEHHCITCDIITPVHLDALRALVKNLTAQLQAAKLELESLRNRLAAAQNAAV
jgi:hypothetical protein